MNYQIKLIIEFKKTKKEIIFEEIITSFKPLILSFVKRVPNFYKEDMYQELLIELYKLINKFSIKNYEITGVHFKSFSNKYGQATTEQNLTIKEIRNDLTYEYNLYCNEKQFISYLNKALDGVTIDFYRRHKDEFNSEIISFNSIVNENLELIDLIPDIPHEKISVFDKYNFSAEELDFMNAFIEGRKIISEAKVAKNLGISQQASIMPF